MYWKQWPAKVQCRGFTYWPNDTLSLARVLEMVTRWTLTDQLALRQFERRPSSESA